MADKTKKATEVKSLEELRQELTTKRGDLIEARQGHAAGELANPRILNTTRKEIARLLTAIRAAELNGKEAK